MKRDAGGELVRDALNFWSIPKALAFLVERQQELDHTAKVELDQLCVRWAKRAVLGKMAEGYSRREIPREISLSRRQVDEAMELLREQNKHLEDQVDLEPLRRQFREAGVKLKE